MDQKSNTYYKQNSTCYRLYTNKYNLSKRFWHIDYQKHFKFGTYFFEETNEDRSCKNIAIWVVMLYIWQIRVFIVHLWGRGLSQRGEKWHVMKRWELLSLKTRPSLLWEPQFSDVFSYILLSDIILVYENIYCSSHLKIT